MEAFTGKVWVLGDDIDTDIIIPTEYLALKTIDDMKQYRTDPKGRHYCSRKELRMRILQRAGTGDHQGTGCAVCHCEIFCPDLFPQLH